MPYNIAWNQDGSVGGEELGDLSPELLQEFLCTDRVPAVFQTFSMSLNDDQLVGPASILQRISVQQRVPIRNAYPAGTPTQLVLQALREEWESLSGAVSAHDVGVRKSNQALVGIAAMIEARQLQEYCASHPDTPVRLPSWLKGGLFAPCLSDD